MSHLFVEQVEGQLESNRLHVGPLQRRRDVHVHVEEPGTQVDGLSRYFSVCPPAHGSPVLGLLDLQLREKLDEPFETFLVPVDPEEVDLTTRSRIKVRIIVFTLLTFLRLNMVEEMSSLHWYSHFGHFFFTCQYLHTKV